MSEASLAAADISALRKITNEEMLDMVLKAAVHPLVQINILVKYLHLTQDPKPKTTEEKRWGELEKYVLPDGNIWHSCGNQ